MGVSATHSRVTMRTMDIYRVIDGKITNHWGVADMLGLMQQLGLMPSQGGG